jgi:N-methylhydantoinase B/oxoprolinase/acetone carboxylase alpha subunit
MQQYAALDFSNFYQTMAQIHAIEKIREVNPALMKKFDEAKKEFEKQEEKERAVREAVQRFKYMASSRELRSYGYGDTGENWRRIPDDLKSTIETFNATPKDQRAAILEAMTQRLKLNPQALQATQRQLEQSSGSGLDLGQGR